MKGSGSQVREKDVDKMHAFSAQENGPCCGDDTRAVATPLLRKEAGCTPYTGEVPPVVHTVLRKPGQPLDAKTRASLEPGFGYSFGNVRVHSDMQAAESARQVSANAYTVGSNVVFGGGQYQPGSRAGMQLLAHELAHVVQQERHIPGGISRDHPLPMSPGRAGGHTTGLILWRQPKVEDKDPDKKTPASQKSKATLTLPSVKLDENLAKLVPPKAAGGTDDAKMPSRVPLFSSGRFSLGLGLNFPGMPEPSEMQEKLLAGHPNPLELFDQRAKIIDQILTGNVPSGWDEADKEKVAGAAWYIFKTHVAPDLARKISSKLSTSTGPGGPSLQLDVRVLTDFKKEAGVGLSLEAHF